MPHTKPLFLSSQLILLYLLHDAGPAINLLLQGVLEAECRAGGGRWQLCALVCFLLKSILLPNPRGTAPWKCFFTSAGAFLEQQLDPPGFFAPALVEVRSSRHPGDIGIRCLVPLRWGQSFKSPSKFSSFSSKSTWLSFSLLKIKCYHFNWTVL